ncbi:MAG: MarR family transcriptional regulator [Peptococcaceae bacterium]|nr:MarR family transcriptional regulator [Peptococcaceae bacterium]
MSDERKLGPVIRQLGNALVKLRNKKAAAFGLTSVQMDVAAYLIKNQDKEEINQLDVQQYLALSNAAVTGIIQRMEEKGFISRRPSSRDGRYNCLKLTQKGMDLEPVLISNSSEVEMIIMQNMTGAEKDEFYRLLKIALNNILTSY